MLAPRSPEPRSCEASDADGPGSGIRSPVLPVFTGGKQVARRQPQGRTARNVLQTFDKWCRLLIFQTDESEALHPAFAPASVAWSWRIAGLSERPDLQHGFVR